MEVLKIREILTQYETIVVTDGPYCSSVELIREVVLVLEPEIT